MTKSIKTVARTFLRVACGISVSLTMSSVGAYVLYEQLPNQVDGYSANVGSGVQFADNFTLSNDATLTSITWWGAPTIGANGPDDFLIRLFGSLSGTGTLLRSYSPVAVTPNSAGNMVAGFADFEYDFTLPSAIELLAGTYYLSVQSLNNDSEWVWETGNGGNGQYHYLQDGTANWMTDSSADLAFRLNGTQTIPEPGSLALIGLALAGLGLMRARASARRS